MAALKMGIGRSLSNSDKLQEQRFDRIDEKVVDLKHTQMYMGDQLSKLSADMNEARVRMSVIQTELKNAASKLDALSDSFNRLVESRSDYGKIHIKEKK